MSDLVLKCEVCGSLLDEEDLFCANCGTEAPQRADGDKPAADTTRLATHNFECSSCGASMSFDASAGALRCPFCASVDMVETRDAKILAPHRVIPFRTTQEQAQAGLRQWLGRGFFRPSDLGTQAAVVQMQPVYVPYWVFRAETHTHWTADTNHTPAGARGDWYPLAGEHRGQYANLLVGASRALSAAETAALCPFDLGPGMPPEQVDLDTVTVEQFSVPRKYARPQARQGLEHLEAETVRQRYVPGRARNVHVNVRAENLSSEPVLLPVWIMAYRYQDKVYRYVANGQTGRATGQAPTSLWKLLLVVLVVAALAVAVLLATGVAATVLSQVPDPDTYDMPPKSAIVAALVYTRSVCSGAVSHRADVFGATAGRTPAAAGESTVGQGRAATAPHKAAPGRSPWAPHGRPSRRNQPAPLRHESLTIA